MYEYYQQSNKENTPFNKLISSKQEIPNTKKSIIQNSCRSKDRYQTKKDECSIQSKIKFNRVGGRKKKSVQ